jgi:starch phosphorylase
MSSYLETDIPSIQRRVVDHVEYTLARDRTNFDKFSAYQVTLSLVIKLTLTGNCL